jgi:hypothetical protein
LSARDLLLRIPVAVVIIMSTIITAWFGVLLLDPFLAGMPDPSASLGWGGADGTTAYFFMSLAVVALIIAAMLWMWLAPVRSDVRQQQRGPF